MAKFAMSGASQLARVDEENEEKIAVTGVSTARLGTASVAGEVERPVTRVSAWMNFWSRERGKGRWLGFLWVFIPLQRSSMVEEVHFGGRDVARRSRAVVHAKGEGDEDEVVVFALIRANGFLGRSWAVVWPGCGLLLGCTMGCLVVCGAGLRWPIR
jgi:hypothetical protein